MKKSYINNQSSFILAFVVSLFFLSCRKDNSVVSEQTLIHYSKDIDALIPQVNMSVVSDIHTIKLEASSKSGHFVFEGIADYDPREVKLISSHINGRIEKLYIKYKNQFVKKGQKIMEVYSPELVKIQKELLSANKGGDYKELINHLKLRLVNLGMTEWQVLELLNKGVVQYNVPIYSPYSGYVIMENNSTNKESNASGSAEAKGGGEVSMGGMGSMQEVTRSGSNAKPLEPNEGRINVLEGMYITKGQILFSLGQPTDLVLKFNIPVSSFKGIKQGSSIKVKSASDDSVNITINHVKHITEDAGNFVQAIAYYSGSKFKPNSVLFAKLNTGFIQGMWIPSMAVYDLGTRQVVFEKFNSTFRPLEIEILQRSEGNTLVSITKELDGKYIAANAQFLIDNESFIKTSGHEAN